MIKFGRTLYYHKRKVKFAFGKNQIGTKQTAQPNNMFYEVSKRFNNLLPEENPTRYSEKQLEIFRLIQSIHKDGLGYRRIAKVLNERGLTTEEGHIWKSPNVYSVIKRYSERLERLKFRRKKYPLVRGKKLKGNFLHSILKKKRLKDEKLEREYPEKWSDFSLEVVDKTILISDFENNFRI